MLLSNTVYHCLGTSAVFEPAERERSGNRNCVLCVEHQTDQQPCNYVDNVRSFIPDTTRLLLARYLKNGPRLVLLERQQSPTDIGEDVQADHIEEPTEDEVLELPPLGRHEIFLGRHLERRGSGCRLYNIFCQCLQLRLRFWFEILEGLLPYAYEAVFKVKCD